MAVYKIFPEKDTFIFSDIPTGNAGKDEITEIGGYSDVFGTGQTNRILIKYDTEDIQGVLTSLVGTNSYSASLHIYLADAYQIPVNYNLYAYPVAASTDWDAGVGKYGDIPTDTSGVSWTFINAGQQNAWLTNSFPTGVTGSFNSRVPGGGTWYTGSNGINLESVQPHVLNSSNDVDIDVTPAIKLFISGTIQNQGFILKLPSTLEFNTTSSIRLKYYGSNTNTIYPPSLDIKWDDSTYNTGSLSILSTSQATIQISNNTGKYVDEGKQRFRLATKPTFPPRTFTTSSSYLVNYALPSGSYWGVRDENTEEMIIDFDSSFTKISCDPTGPFFDIYMDGLQPERYYRILVKTVLDGSTTVVDNSNIFKVVRNGQ